jgi:hypothetical protein
MIGCHGYHQILVRFTSTHEIYNVAGIHTSPAGLESTSLVLSYGLGK